MFNWRLVRCIYFLDILIIILWEILFLGYRWFYLRFSGICRSFFKGIGFMYVVLRVKFNFVLKVLLFGFISGMLL